MTIYYVALLRTVQTVLTATMPALLDDLHGLADLMYTVPITRTSVIVCV